MSYVVQRFTAPGPGGVEVASLDSDGNLSINGAFQVDGVAVASIDTSGGLIVPDGIALALGTDSDDSLANSGTNFVWTHITGDWTLDNQLVTGSTIMLLGTDTTATDFQVQNNSAAAIFSVTPTSAALGTTQVVGTLDLNGLLDQDAALTGTGDAANILATMTHATQVAEGLDVHVTQLTNARTGGTLTAIMGGTTSLAGDLNSVVYSDFTAATPTDGGGTVVHSAYTVQSGHDRALDLTLCATGEALIAMKDNLAVAVAFREAANVYQTFCTTNDAERITHGKVLATTITTVDMADAAGALVYGTAGAGEFKLLGNTVWCDPNSGQASEILTLPAVATSVGVTLHIVNTGGEGIVVKDVGATTVITLDTLQHGWVTCNGTIWLGAMGAIT